AAGSTLQLSSVGAYSLTLAFLTTASQRADISGNLIINANNSFNNTFTTNTPTTNIVTVSSTGSIVNNGGLINSTSATLVFGNNGTYTHNMDGGTIPTAAWYNAVGPVI